jgi:lipoprotein-anchoring transpeptidase ErfK/SrfK
VRPARLAIAAVAAALAAGLVQAPALAESSTPAGSTPTVVILDNEPTDASEPPVDPAVPAPTGLRVALGADSATISFTAPVTAKAITNYQWADQGGVWVAFDPAVTTSPVTISNIQPGQPYSVALRAVTADGVGAASVPVNFRINVPKPPKPTRPVVFEVDDQPLGKPSGSKVITVKPGAVLKLRNVPEGSTISIVDRKDASFTLPVRETTKARTWVTETLPPTRRLWVTVTDSSGVVAGRTNFKMGRAEQSFTVDVWPKASNMGAGVPLVVDFGIPITNKAEVERALVVTSDKDYGEAGWFWVDSKKAVFRPRDYWPGNATITLNANLTSIEGAKGVWGPRIQSSFKTGDQVILKVNLDKHTMKYTRNGVEERTLKISGGKAGWTTEAGTKILTAHIPDKRLYNPDPEEGWDVTVKWAIRVNDNGEYIHDATWNYSIGYANTSHGCTNLTYSDMSWLWRNTKFGDVAEYTGSSEKIGTDDYLAGYWNYTWPEWKRGSALWQDS